ncbi:MAG TPA: TetR/AcrR family transcriptional regulator [Solirubrobacteraceae bacterium]
MSVDESAGGPATDGPATDGPATDGPPPPRQPRPRGRKAEAAINDGLILQAAREVLTTAPDTPMAEIAARAHVGVGSLYRRFPSKEALAYRLCLDGMSALADVARDSLDDLRREDPWQVFVGFIHGAIEAGAGSLRGLAGTFVPDDALNRVAVEMAALIQELLDRVQAAGAVRDDITANDVGLFFEMLRAIRVGDPKRSDQLRGRYIDLFAPGFRPAASKLRGTPPTWAEISGPWNP